MLLRRITEHVNAQNWFAVGLDFLIVVLGVFIGIQVSNWNAARSDSALECVLVESLQRDFEAIVGSDNDRYERTIAAPVYLARLIKAIRSGDEPESSVVWPGLEAGVTGYATTQPSPTYDELRSTGRLSRLTNAALRCRLAEFERSRENEAEISVMLSNVSLKSTLFEHVDLSTADAVIGLTGTYRWEGVMQTLPYLQERLLYAQAQAHWRRNSREHAEAILKLIEEDVK